jgi:hypothetical protein
MVPEAIGYAGYRLGYCEIQTSPTFRWAGLPLPIGFFVLEGDHWTDFIPPPPVQWTNFLADILAPVLILVIPFFVIWRRRDRMRGDDEGTTLPLGTNRRPALRFRMSREDRTLDRLPSCPYGSGRLGTLNREWTPMNANDPVAGFVTVPGRRGHCLAADFVPRRLSISSRVFASIRGCQIPRMIGQDIPDRF